MSSFKVDDFVVLEVLSGLSDAEMAIVGGTYQVLNVSPSGNILLSLPHLGLWWVKPETLSPAGGVLYSRPTYKLGRGL